MKMSLAVMQGLILTGVVGIVTMLWNQNATLVELKTQTTALQAIMTDLPGRVTKLETNQEELLRRQNRDELRWEHLGEQQITPFAPIKKSRR